MTRYRLKRHANVDVQFEGELITEATTDDGVKDRWQTLRLYRTDRGIYVLERLGESRVAGEVTMRSVTTHPNAHQVRKKIQRRRPDGEVYFTIVALELLAQAAKRDATFAAEAVDEL